MKSYYIHFIRNGLTEGNVSGKYIGHIDEPLSDEGVAQILQMKKDYRYPKAEAVFSSPLSRCTQTAKLLFPDRDPIVIDGLIEYNFGEFEGKTAEELQNHPVFPDWLAGKADVQPPFGESNNEFANRIATAFIKIVDGLIEIGSVRNILEHINIEEGRKYKAVRGQRDGAGAEILLVADGGSLIEAL